MTPLSQSLRTKQSTNVSNATPVFWKSAPLVAEPEEPKPPTPDLRDFFAAAALQGLLSRDAGRNVSTIADYESKRAVCAYRLADEMLKARSRKAGFRTADAQSPTRGTGMEIAQSVR